MTSTEHTINGMQMVIDNLRKRVEIDSAANLAAEQENARLKARLKAIVDYDRMVQGIIKSNPNLERQWDEFRVLYQLTASDALLATAIDKIKLSPRKEGDGGATEWCDDCHRLKYDDPLAG